MTMSVTTCMSRSSSMMLMMVLAGFLVGTGKGSKGNPPAPVAPAPVAPAPVPAPTNAPDVDVDISACFSGDMMVQVDDGRGRIPMKELQIGDSVLTGSDYHSKVYSFGHWNSHQYAEFVQIYYTRPTTLENNDGGGGGGGERRRSSAIIMPPLEMTHEHLVYVQGKKNPVRADSIRIGDVLVSAAVPPLPRHNHTNHNDDNVMEMVVVTRLSTVRKLGVYAPLTQDGRIVVNGIVASTYISVQEDYATEHVELLPSQTQDTRTIVGRLVNLFRNHNSHNNKTKRYSKYKHTPLPITTTTVTWLSHHTFGHIVLSPYRLICRFVLPSSSSTTTTTTTTNGRRLYNSAGRRPGRGIMYNEDGIPYYISYGMKLTRWIHNLGGFFQIGGLTIMLLFTGTFYVLEELILLLVGKTTDHHHHHHTSMAGMISSSMVVMIGVAGAYYYYYYGRGGMRGTSKISGVASPSSHHHVINKSKAV